MYEYTDKCIALMNKQFIRIFDRLKGRLASMDQISAISTVVKQTYSELDHLTRKILLKAAKKAYHTAGGKGDIIDLIWLDAFLSGYNPVTKYAYTQEVDRKRARLFESLAATDKSPKEIKTALRLWSQMAGEYAVEATDAAVLEAYSKLGVKQVRWITEVDERRCTECASRHNKIYLMGKVPSKPHWRCRCVLVPA